MASPHNHSTLPHIQPLIRLSQSLALLDALLEPEWQYRYYSLFLCADREDLSCQTLKCYERLLSINLLLSTTLNKEVEPE